MQNHNMDAMLNSIQIGGKMVFDSRANLYGHQGKLDSLNVKNTLTVDSIVANSITVEPRNLIPLSASDQRRTLSYQNRVNTAYDQYSVIPPAHPNNGDEDLYSNHIGNFSKGLPHNSLGEPTLVGYASLLAAVNSGETIDYDAIVTGHPDAKLKNPQAAVAFDLQGSDSHSLYEPLAPAFASAWRAGEAVEVYWMSLMRDVSFRDFGTGTDTDSAGLTAAACAELNALTDFRGTKASGLVTPGTLFRMNPAGVVGGPFISQFLYKDAPYGSVSIDQRMTTPISGSSNDFLKDFPEWLAIQNGQNPITSLTMDGTKRYIRNGRDLGQWVHIDALNQLAMHALMVLFSINCPLNVGNPYNNSNNQCGFSTFGGPHILTLIAEVCTRALHAQWYQKWNVHRTLRPEEYGGRIDRHKIGAASYPLHADVLNSDAINRVYTANGTWLCPMAFPEGCPLHPAYGSGHATVAGATITVLKAWFNGSFVIPSPVQASADGTSLDAYVGALTVEGELNKLAMNISQGRCMAGVHWRSDSDESIVLGEKIAMEILKDQRGTFNENFVGFTFNKFDGTTVTI